MTSTNAQKEKLRSLVSRREKYFERLQRLYDISRSLTADSLNSFLSRYARIDEYYCDFEKTQDDIDTLCAAMDPADAVETKESTAAFEDMYFAVKAAVLKHNLSSHVEKASPSPSAPATAVAPIVQPRLPKLEIPTFSGSLKEWSNFHSLFRSTIHRRTDISGVEKLQYLRSFLKGPPLTLIENLQIVEGSYEIAYKLLCSRYDDKRNLAAHYLNCIFNFKQLSSDHVTGLRHFVETFQTNVAAIKNLGLPDIGDFLLLQLGLRALSAETKKLFEDKYSETAFPKFDDLIQFINNQCAINDRVCLSSPGAPSRTPTIRSTPPQKTPYINKSYLSTVDSSFDNCQYNFSHISSNVSPSKRVDSPKTATCFFCKNPHNISKCPSFLKLSVEKRIEAIKSNQRCFNCFGNHLKYDCRSTSRCQRCKKAHHTLIHNEVGPPPGPVVPKPTVHASTLPTKPNGSQSVSCQMSTSETRECSVVMLGTAWASIIDAAGNHNPVRVIVDPGSEVSCISSECVERLGLKRFNCGVSLSGIGDNGVPNSKGAVLCTLATSNRVCVSENVQAIVLSRIASRIPSAQVSQEVVSRFSSLPLADPEFYKPGPIDFLLGAELYCKILVSNPNSVIPGEPTAIQTTLGWILLGRAPTDVTQRSVTSFLIQSPSLDTLLQRFWEIEEVETAPINDPEDDICEAHFQKTHYRDSSGRYVVALPFQGDISALDVNRQSALRQYNSLEKRLDRNPALKREYNDFFSDYKTQNHMTICPAPSSYVIPHHAVIKETSSTTKVRAVFNASYSSPRGLSLNKLLMKGPKLQKDICDIILNLRGHRIVVCADIRQMYRQILVRPEDRKYQHIFWREDPNGMVNEYELATVTYGISPSAFQAQRVLKQLVSDEGTGFPLASKAVLNETYIDDILTGGKDINEALQLKQELIDLLKKGCFELRKWSSNCQAILDTVPLEHCEVPLRENEEPSFKILGLHWEPKIDSFAYSVSEIQLRCTKRSILSQVARMFDPLGWLAPVIFWAKTLLQTLWLSNLSWDDNIPTNLCEEWTNFASQLKLLENIKIPRFIDSSHCENVQVVGFCDASTKGYAAIIYLCVFDSNLNKNNVYLLKAKSKVAPAKQLLSIPRLELCAALLLSRLYLSLQNYLSKYSIKSVSFYSDSNIVLAWLRTQPHLLQTYVANRVVEINKVAADWYHVSTADNPCDCASRGLLPSQLVSHPLWWQGPSFISFSDDHWPTGQGQSVQEIPELKKNTQTLVVTEPKPTNYLFAKFQEISKFTRAQRVFAYVLRFVHNCRSSHSSSKFTGPLCVNELKSSLILLTKLEQAFHFKHVILSLQENMPLKDSALCKVTPFLDAAGLLRVGGRLRHAELPYDSRHPLLLSKSSHLSKLLCDHYHVTYLHAGPRTVQAIIQQKFWIISLRGLLRQRIFKCLKCYRYNAKPPQPIMSDLPRARVAQQRPFLTVGVDFGGPFFIKESGRRNARSYKSYLCLFICFSTKAVHLELVTDLSSAAFLAAFDRFVGRRSLPRVIYSDNGTNFTASARELNEVYATLQRNSSEISSALAQREVTWVFNPPAASNFGGLWEAGIKSAKHHLRRVIGEQLLTYEEFSTLLCKIEAILNSRPLVDVSTEPLDGLDYLTPGHFLVGTSLLSAPEEDVSTVPLNRLTRWRLLRKASQSFWNAWSTSYLQSLTPRKRWLSNESNIKVGDLVIVPALPRLPLHWPLGRVILVHPGRDNVTRVVTIKTSNSTLTRPLNKLIPLKVE